MQTAHIGINVTNLERSREFYGEVFGLTGMGGSDASPRRFAFLGDGTNIVLTLWEQSEGRFEGGRPGLHHLSFMVPSIDAVREAEKKLLLRGATFAYEGIVPHREGAQSGGIFFEDPDGSRLEIFAPAGASEQKAPGEGPTCGFF
jgi:catechol 2,3-dioxygenase-like lactoylglutathione lyase family enzyme